MIRQIKINDKMNAEVVNQIDKTTITLSIEGKAIITFSAPIYKGVSYDIVYDDNYFEIYSKQKDLKELKSENKKMKRNLKEISNSTLLEFRKMKKEL